MESSRKPASGESGKAGRGLVQPSDSQIVLTAIQSFARGFSAAYLVNILLLLAPKLARMFSKRWTSYFFLAFSLSGRLLESTVAACRTGGATGWTLRETLFEGKMLRTSVFVGAYSGIYRLVGGLLRKYRGESKQSNTIIAAVLAGLSITLEVPEQRKEIAHNLVFR